MNIMLALSIPNKEGLCEVALIGDSRGFALSLTRVPKLKVNYKIELRHKEQGVDFIHIWRFGWLKFLYNPHLFDENWVQSAQVCPRCKESHFGCLKGG